MTLTKRSRLASQSPSSRCRDGRAGALGMLDHQRPKLEHVGLADLLEGHARAVAATLRELPGLVVDVGDAAAHAGGEVAARRPEHDDAPAGHVLAAVVPDALDHRVRAGVAHREALARRARGRRRGRWSRRRARCCR